MNIKQIIEMDLRGHDYTEARGISPKITKQNPSYKYQPPTDFEVNGVRMINSWQVADELRFVGAI